MKLLVKIRLFHLIIAAGENVSNISQGNGNYIFVQRLIDFDGWLYYSSLKLRAHCTCVTKVPFQI